MTHSEHDAASLQDGLNDALHAAQPVLDVSLNAVTRAEDVQREASDPRASVFVSASAGSGKTKLLIDRLLRLMLPVAGQDLKTGLPMLIPGVPPARILSLTYTKAAAAEMSTRLQTLLGTWVTMDDAQLDAALQQLDVPRSHESRDAARALFAQVLDCPGGMRIGTIHAFCQSLLRRFPLEAAVAPQFEVLEDADIAAALSTTLEDEVIRVAAGPKSDALENLSQVKDFDTIRKFAASLYAGRGAQRGFQLIKTLSAEHLRQLYTHLFDIHHARMDIVENALVQPDDEVGLRQAINALSSNGTETQQERFASMAAWLDAPMSVRDPQVWQRLFLTDKGQLRSIASFIRKKDVQKFPDFWTVIEREGQRLIAQQRLHTLLKIFETNASAIDLVLAALTRLDQEKARQGLVDYEDLISATKLLLCNPGAAWVLYCLDGGVDHLLLDEVQDTSPAQWDIARALTDDFFSCEVSMHRPRTVFAVGDFKQSIFSFQGAEPKAFVEARHIFRQKVQDSGQLWRAPQLDVSFRSVAPILRLVDAVFSQPTAAEGLLDSTELAPAVMPVHRPARAQDPGRVELWPRLPRDTQTDDHDPWAAIDTNQIAKDAPQRMADAIARWLEVKLGAPPAEGQSPLKPGDVLILVRRRSNFLWALVRALKSRNIPVSTLVRTSLVDQVAAQDLLALCEALLLPQNDLMLANVLTSPIGSLTDDALMALAMDRGKRPLWAALQDRHTERADWSFAWNMLSALLARLDYAAPHDILSDALGRFGARARFLSRLGVEARDAIDDMLEMSLHYESEHAPSMQGFVTWMRASDGTIKRDSEAESAAIRIMTVHASKGLQSRLVILPDTEAYKPPRPHHHLVRHEDIDLPLLNMSGLASAPRVAEMMDKGAQKAREESHRLLYVALTRARDWLVVCGWESGKTVSGGTDWYALCAEGFAQLESVDASFSGGWEGVTRVHGSIGYATDERAASKEIWDTHAGPQAELASLMPALFGAAPFWKAVALPQEPRHARPLAPSRPEGAVFGALPAARSPLAGAITSARAHALARGEIIHRLLQYLPDIPPASRIETARTWLQRTAFRLHHAEIEKLISDVLGVISHPQLRPLFSKESRAEQSITGMVNNKVVVGQVDRHAFVNGCLYVCDFKTNQNPPKDAIGIPETYRRQMAAYVKILSDVYAPNAIVAVLVWTEGAHVTVLPDAMLDVSL